MKIYSINGEEVYDLQLNESTTLTRRLMVENTVTLVYNSTTAVALSVGDYFDFQYRWGDAPEQQVNERYTLNEPPSVKVDDRGIYSYSALFVGHLHMLDSRMIDTENDNVDYYFFGTPTAHLDFIMSKINGDTTEYSYSINEDVGGEPKNINYASMSLLSALHKFCEEYKCEFDLLGKRFSFAKKVENETAITFEIGKGKGLYSIHQGKLANEKIATVVYPFGGTTNMVNGKRLAIPERKVERGVETYGVRENRMVFEDIFPERSGAITTDATRKESGSAYWKVTDASLDFDLKQQLLEDAVIEFTSGDCTGVQFKIVSYEHASRTIVFMEKVEEESDTKRGVLPNEQRTPKRGDSYHFLNIVMPDSYVVEAQKRLREAAAAELERVAVPQVSYTVEVDSRFLKTQEWRPSNGDVVNVVNQELNYEIKIRIIGISFPLCAPDKIKLTLSENILTSAAQSMLTSIRKDIQTAVKANRFHPMGGNFSTPLVAEKLVANTIHSRHFSGSGFEQSGWSIGAHPDFSGQTLAVVDYLSVRKAINVHEIVANQVKYMGGKMIFSAAAIEIIQQEELPQSRQWKVTFDTHEGKQTNQFVVNDLVLCQQFDAKNRQTKRYHWIVDGVGTDYLILRLGIMSDGVPEVGDLLVQYGHLTNAQRQHAYVIDTIGGARTTLLGGLNYAGAGGKVVAELGFVDGRPKFFVGNENSFINYDPSDASSQLKIKAAVEFSSNSTGLDKLPQWKEIEKQMDNVNIPQVQVRTSADVVTSGKGFSPASISAQLVLKVGDKREVLDKKQYITYTPDKVPPGVWAFDGWSSVYPWCPPDKSNQIDFYSSNGWQSSCLALPKIVQRLKVSFRYKCVNSDIKRLHIENNLFNHTPTIIDVLPTPTNEWSSFSKIYNNWNSDKFSVSLWGTDESGISYVVNTDSWILEEADDIEFSGRNYLLKPIPQNWEINGNWTINGYNLQYINLPEYTPIRSNFVPALRGDKFYVSMNVISFQRLIAEVTYHKNRTQVDWLIQQPVSNIGRLEIPINVDYSGEFDSIRVTLFSDVNTSGNTSISNLKLSKTSTPWSPAPEDATLQLNGAPYTPNTEVPSSSADSFTFTSDWNGQSDSRTVVVTPGTSLDYLKEATSRGKTIHNGGVLLSNILAVQDVNGSDDESSIRAGISGLSDDSIAFFADPSNAYRKAVDYLKGVSVVKPQYMVDDKGCGVWGVMDVLPDRLVISDASRNQVVLCNDINKIINEPKTLRLSQSGGDGLSLVYPYSYATPGYDQKKIITLMDETIDVPMAYQFEHFEPYVFLNMNVGCRFVSQGASGNVEISSSAVIDMKVRTLVYNNERLVAQTDWFVINRQFVGQYGGTNAFDFTTNNASTVNIRQGTLRTVTEGYYSVSMEGKDVLDDSGNRFQIPASYSFLYGLDSSDLELYNNRIIISSDGIYADLKENATQVQPGMMYRDKTGAVIVKSNYAKPHVAGVIGGAEVIMSGVSISSRRNFMGATIANNISRISTGYYFISIPDGYKGKAYNVTVTALGFSPRVAVVDKYSNYFYIRIFPYNSASAIDSSFSFIIFAV